MAVHTHHDVVDTPGGQTTAVARTRHFSPGQLLSGAVGLVLVVFGIMAVVRTGVDSSLNTPGTDIMGLAHSTWIGFAELGAGLLLLVGSADVTMRGVAGAIGALLVIAGVVVAAGTSQLLRDIGTERATGWFLAVMGGIALLGSMIPSLSRTDRAVATDRR